MARKRELEECAICGKQGPLSFEHVPPNKAFNDRRVFKAELGKHFLSLGAEEIRMGEISQKGMGEYSLCIKCNNDTGGWYGSHFIGWCYQGMDILVKCKGKPTLLYLNYLFPLSILKQIITMFFSVSYGSLRHAHPELVRFVLNKEMKYLNPKYRIFVYYNIEGRFRWMGNCVRANFQTGTFDQVLELSFPPFGYYMTCNGAEPPNPSMFEITYFANFGYKEFSVQTMALPVLPTWSIIPGDYRQKNEYDESNKKSRFNVSSVRLKFFAKA